MNLLQEERETIILFNEADELVEVEAHNTRLKKRLYELHRQRPNDVYIGRVDKYATVFTFPKSWIRIWCRYFKTNKD